MRDRETGARLMWVKDIDLREEKEIPSSTPQYRIGPPQPNSSMLRQMLIRDGYAGIWVPEKSNGSS